MRGARVCGSIALLVAACGTSARPPDYDSSFERKADAGPVVAEGGARGAPVFADDGGIVDELAGCASDVRSATPSPLDLDVMLDQSGSMAFSTGTGSTKWAAVRSAFAQFVGDARSTGLGVGLGFFPYARPSVPDVCATSADCNGFGPCATRVCDVAGPLRACDSPADCPGGAACERLGTCGTGGATCLVGHASATCSALLCVAVGNAYCEGKVSCDAADYATPEVPIATLPAGAIPLLTAFDRHSPAGGTPTAGALAGLLSRARGWAAAHPTHPVFTVLVTDGVPTSCAVQDADGLASLARAAKQASPSVGTYVVGVFAPSEAADARPILDAIAAAGGTTRAIVLDAAADVAAQLVTALNAIRLAETPCTYAVPVPASGEPDYDKVNVRTKVEGEAPRTIPSVSGAAACDPAHGGWYYDARPPTAIQLCPASCATLKSDPRIALSVVLGCRTVIQ